MFSGKKTSIPTFSANVAFLSDFKMGQKFRVRVKIEIKNLIITRKERKTKIILLKY